MEAPTLTPLYCNSLTEYSRFVTREVKIGDVPLGADHPIRVQSMTTTDTMNTLATVEQSIRMIEAGCEYVRITAPSINEARNLEVIRKELHLRGFRTPIIADIHFTPNAAELAARIVEKVRVNPGNYADRKKFETIEYTDSAYAAELDRIRQRFTPLVKICKEYGTAMRIGTNHGSLSDRIMSRYGDTPLGMVESALEFLRICEDHSFYNVVLSMKSSNPQVMVQAYRLLIVKMRLLGMNYPLHLGVTEAGEGEDGRIKSATGIGTLLEDGIGDTIRVSLTEDPEFEIPVAKDLVNRYSSRIPHQEITVLPETNSSAYTPYEYNRRHSFAVLNTGASHVPVVIADFSGKTSLAHEDLQPAGYKYSSQLDKWNLSDQACDYVYCGNTSIDFEIPGTLGILYDYSTWISKTGKDRTYPVLSGSEFMTADISKLQLKFIRIQAEFLYGNPEFIHRIKNDHSAMLILETANRHAMADLRRAFLELHMEDIHNPVIIKRDYTGISMEQLQLYAATDAGALLLDGFGDGIWLHVPGITTEKNLNALAFGILQASRTRISKTEYISCPSCGRTLFDLQETTAKIRSRTDHLKGLKIGIMGCIVNGPGEMADADYGYVGVGVGKITLYKGKEVVKRNITSDIAVDELIQIIKLHGDWIDP